MGIPRDHKEAAEKNRRGQAGLDSVHRDKRAAAPKDPGADRSAESADKAKRDWNKDK